MTPRELAAEHAARRRARVAQVRKTVAAVAVCLFIVLFSGIYVQMALGHDPALAAKSSVTKKSSATSTTTTTSSTGSTAVSPVTTSQS
jgi:hypothetical protein